MLIRGGITTVVILGVALYYTGAAQALWLRMQSLDTSCYSAMQSMGTHMGDPICRGVTKVMQTMDLAVDEIAGRIGYSTGAMRDEVLNAANRNMGDYKNLPNRLVQMIADGPSKLTGSEPAQQLQQSMDSFAIGQHFMATDGTPTRALPWLKQGAAQPGYGVMSQLSLGDLYRTGGNGISPDPVLAEVYYQKAKTSLTLLAQSNTAEAKQALSRLPASPQKTAQQLDAVLAQLKAKK